MSGIIYVLLLRAVTCGWNGYRNKSQHRKSTLEKKILPPLPQGSNLWPFSHKSSTLTTELSPPPCLAYLQPSSPISTFKVYSASFFLIIFQPFLQWGTADAKLRYPQLRCLHYWPFCFLKWCTFCRFYTFYSLSCHVGAIMPITSLWCAVLLVMCVTSVEQ